jgi:hypothetical protein
MVEASRRIFYEDAFQVGGPHFESKSCVLAFNKAASRPWTSRIKERTIEDWKNLTKNV